MLVQKLNCLFLSANININENWAVKESEAGNFLKAFGSMVPEIGRLLSAVGDVVIINEERKLK